MARSTYVLSLGSNRRTRFGSPERTIAAALAAMERRGLQILARSGVKASLPVGPSSRRFANAVALIATDLEPSALLAELKRIERDFGRRPGRRWGARPLDLDIVLWSGGVWAEPGLIIPHPGFRERSFVLEPLLEIAPDWRDPLTCHTIRQLHARLTRRRA